ncbi:uncharacterized protein K444DRAFT_626980 [Hyaloscypha bicolor E]|uniref:Clr5 domain-containing protein n=1 Tax=Hyaloscypha bicolor E TaxID=1095630 RepID=A0A2J6TJQ0_9HELO|nr:uncharacterized protein K444DRAFT_626980 [Hyaloscypha bicolor E]PMD63245.1 hypothetical protein K444DRAFT_626980 [Hyaloscypha bicolor E]
MVGNVTTSTLQDHAGEPPTQEYWDKIKPDVFRIYIEGDKSGNIKPANLEDTMAEIQRSHGLQGCVRTWKDKIKEWGFSKNISTRNKQWIAAKGTKRKQEGKDTAFFQGGVRIAPTKIQDCKRRKTRTMSFPLSAPSTTSHACWIHSPDSERQSLTTSMADMQQLPSISGIDLWMADKNQPWSQYALRRQTGDNVERVLAEFELLPKQLEDAGLTEHKNKFEEGQASEYLSNRQDSPLELRCISDRFLAESHSTIVNEQWEETVEESSLECVSDLAVKLASSHIEHDESAPQTLKKEFELAEALERMGQYEKAEYHCRRILDIHSQIVVEAFLGKILAKTHRFEEATFLLFHALAAFIILFIQNSLDENARLFARIEAVMIELLLQSDEGAPSLTDHWGLMRDTLQKPTSDGEIYQICPQLFLHGFSFAHECLALGLVDSNQCSSRDRKGNSSPGICTSFEKGKEMDI